MDTFLKAYFKKFEYSSIDSYDFKDFFKDFYSNHENISRIDWNSWLISAGKPPAKPNYNMDMFEVIVNWQQQLVYCLSCY